MKYWELLHMPCMPTDLRKLHTSIFSHAYQHPLPQNRDLPTHWISLKFIRQNFPSTKFICPIFHREKLFNLIIGNLFLKSFSKLFLELFPPQLLSFWVAAVKTKSFLFIVWRQRNLFMLDRYRFQKEKGEGREGSRDTVTISYMTFCGRKPLFMPQNTSGLEDRDQ